MSNLDDIDGLTSWICEKCRTLKVVDNPNVAREVWLFAWATVPALFAVAATLFAPPSVSTLVWVFWVMCAGNVFWGAATASAARRRAASGVITHRSDSLLIRIGPLLEVNANSLGLAVVAVPAVYSWLGNRPYETSWIPVAVVCIAAAQLVRSFSSVMAD
jgi:hypothetical protein